MEGLEKNNFEEQKPSSYFEGKVNSSKEFLAAKRFVENYLKTGKVTLDLTDTPENIDAVRKEIDRLGNRLIPGAVPEVVVEELRKGGVFKKYIPEAPKPKEPEFVETKYVKLEGPKPVELSPEQVRMLEANLLLEEIEKANVFKNTDELNSIHLKSTELQKGNVESLQHYYEFSGLVKGGREEIDRDLEALQRAKGGFSQQKVEDAEQREKIERAKKIATITERALALGVSKFSWYGEDVSIEPVSEFDDVKRGVDDILEIRKEDDDSTFLGLGIDVTFRGLQSEQFKQKFFTLLQSIHDGYQTKVKYFKNHRGEKMREFSIPKMVLYFNPSDVKELVEIVRGAENPQAADTLKQSPQKEKVLTQVIGTCHILSEFAKESKNNIFRKYNAVLSSITEISWKNEDVRHIMESSRKDTDITKHLKGLVKEFRMLQSAQAA